MALPYGNGLQKHLLVKDNLSKGEWEWRGNSDAWSVMSYGINDVSSNVS